MRCAGRRMLAICAARFVSRYTLRPSEQAIGKYVGSRNPNAAPTPRTVDHQPIERCFHAGSDSTAANPVRDTHRNPVGRRTFEQRERDTCLYDVDGLAGGLAIAAVAGAMIGPGSVHASSTKALLTDLNSPKGIAVGADGALIIAQGAFGPPDPVLRYHPRLFRREGGAIPSPIRSTSSTSRSAHSTGPAGRSARRPVPVPPVRRRHDRARAEHRRVPGRPTPTRSTIDNFAQPGSRTRTGSPSCRTGDALVADAAANDVIRVTPAGDTTTVARFDLEVISTAHVPLPFPFPEVPAEAVPTTVVVGPTGPSTWVS